MHTSRLLAFYSATQMSTVPPQTVEFRHDQTNSHNGTGDLRGLTAESQKTDEKQQSALRIKVRF